MSTSVARYERAVCHLSFDRTVCGPRRWALAPQVLILSVGQEVRPGPRGHPDTSSLEPLGQSPTQKGLAIGHTLAAETVVTSIPVLEQMSHR